MAKNWTQPKDWVLDDVFNAPILNQHIRDNLEYVAEPAASWKRYTYATTTDVINVINTWEHIEELDVEITTSLSRVMYTVTLPIVDAASDVAVDVYVPELNVYLSSLTATPSTYGLAYRQSANNAYDIPLTVQAPIELIAGSYTFEVWMRAGVAGTNLQGGVTIIPMVWEF